MKALVNRISQELLGAPVTYTGVPSCAYRIGACITIDREGNIEITNNDAMKILMPFFIEQGWTAATTTVDSQAAENTDGESPEVDDPETPAEDLQAPSDSIDDTETMVSTNECSISLPANMTVSQLINLTNMLYSEQRLLNKAAMGGRLTIPESLITRLMEQAPETPEAFSELLHDYEALGELTGFSYKEGSVRLDFAHTDAHPEYELIYAGLVGRIIHTAKEATRVKAELQDSENEKYYMRAWLLRLGYGGADLKAERRLLLQNLSGHSAFSNDDAAEKHKQKYAAIRLAKREANTNAT